MRYSSLCTLVVPSECRSLCLLVCCSRIICLCAWPPSQSNVLPEPRTSWHLFSYSQQLVPVWPYADSVPEVRKGFLERGCLCQTLTDGLDFDTYFFTQGETTNLIMCKCQTLLKCGASKYSLQFLVHRLLFYTKNVLFWVCNEDQLVSSLQFFRNKLE